MNSYQKRKAKLVAATLLMACCASTMPLTDLPRAAAAMNEAQWRAVSFNAGVPVLDTDARVLVVAILECHVS